MTIRKMFMLTTVVLVAAGSPAYAQRASRQAAEAVPGTAVFASLSDAEIARRVQMAVRRYEARPEFVGLSVAVARGDHLIVDEGVGIADLEWKAPTDAKSPFRIGSLTKQFTAAAIMKLREQGKIGLDDPLSKYLPDFDTKGHTVTIRQLLTHTSGIPNYTAQPGFFAQEAPLDLTDQQVLATIQGVPLDFDPGAKWEYSNTNYYLLGMIVAKLSGMAYADYLQQAFFRPLGLTHTRYGATAPIIPERAQGYSYLPATHEHLNSAAISMNVPGGAGALISTAGDLVRWQIALTGGRAVTAASYHEMIASAVPTGQGDGRYGFGLGIGTQLGHQVISHSGGINGFNSVLSYVPDIGLRIAVISNSDALPSDAVGNDIFATLTSDKPLPPFRTTPQPGAEAALRKFIEDQVNDRIDYSTMTQPMADLVRAHPEGKAMFTAWGPIKAITFVGVDVGGMDTYRVEFTSGPPVLFDIFRNDDGKIASLRFRPAAPPPAP
jgi:CubicO group peptidase (beta-lactamase class C family)